MSKEVQVLDKMFKVSIPSEEIQQSIQRLAQQINSDLKGKEVIFIGILNGCFMFAGDLFKHIDLECQITFLKLASYQGTSSSGNVKRLIGINENIEGKTVVIIEDIIDTGNTLDSIIKQLKGYEPAEIKVATLLYKPDAYEKTIPIDYMAFKIPNDFIIGYGLDYDGFGRNLKDIYTIIP
ncbi:MAG TPA: hypoxanthine phosphoribosyltransferase [Marinilabiliales bacterium]|jgi:hypoxanthine phosphoribosyltransferase|nr:MAG: hypoxanthine phosphoribosyltransferase [Bacteroidetes bacterium GWA2_40_14]OFX62792.1 MAG: hypoxanthine phosphoribosyltransferase [Bacteroidetes bacterium GWC2_40_13]OFX72133.1 MAG: hypoxanthine phosphoribosyltransferase [Bacteroidetes bacterium GWD2_40_43]OFX92519.1 MAG: hypoxanthine phosphoribosyltransferase [Bacteroidetes bacterium GWE2_40_63]OFY16457.1 MAG: hypoxanthine phosphoribosyltransferase [Bacteroidetes bacterium GWF2_40_13]OFZ27198.1 MAG: hypoxanthine phosphoribosyltransfer